MIDDEFDHEAAARSWNILCKRVVAADPHQTLNNGDLARELHSIEVSQRQAISTELDNDSSSQNSVEPRQDFSQTPKVI